MVREVGLPREWNPKLVGYGYMGPNSARAEALIYSVSIPGRAEARVIVRPTEDEIDEIEATFNIDWTRKSEAIAWVLLSGSDVAHLKVVPSE